MSGIGLRSQEAKFTAAKTRVHHQGNKSDRKSRRTKDRKVLLTYSSVSRKTVGARLLTGPGGAFVRPVSHGAAQGTVIARDEDRQ